MDPFAGFFKPKIQPQQQPNQVWDPIGDIINKAAQEVKGGVGAIENYLSGGKPPVNPELNNISQQNAPIQTPPQPMQSQPAPSAQVSNPTTPTNPNPIEDAITSTADTANQWGLVPQQIVQSITHQPITQPPPESPSAQRGDQLIQGSILGQPGAPEMQAAGEMLAPAINQGIQAGGEAANAVKNGAVQTVQDLTAGTPESQFGGIKMPGSQPPPPPPNPEAPSYNIFLNGQKQTVADLPKGTGQTYAPIDLPASVYGAGKEAQVQNTVNNYVPGANATEQYANLEPTMQHFSNQIKGVMANDPKTATVDDINNMFKKNLADRGVYRTSNSSKDAINVAAKNYATDLFNEAKKNSPNIDPQNITDAQVLDLKQKANADAKSIYKKIDNGTTLTDKDQAILSGRDALDATLTKMHPEIKDLTMKQSNLYDAADSLKAGRTAENNAKPPPSFMDRVGSVLKNPIVDASAGMLGLGELGRGGKDVANAGSAAFQAGTNLFNNAKNMFSSTPTANSAKNPFTSSTGMNVQNATQSNSSGLQKDGTYALPNQTSADPNYMTDQERQARESAISPYDPAYGNKINQIENEYKQGQDRASTALSGEKLTFMSGAKDFVDLGNQVKNDFAQMPPDFVNGLKGVSSWKAYNDANPNNPYSSELTHIDALNTGYTAAVRMITGEKLTPGSNQLINPGDSPNQAFEKWNNMMKYISSNYSKNLSPYLAKTSGTATNTLQGQPIPAPSLQQRAPVTQQNSQGGLMGPSQNGLMSQ